MRKVNWASVTASADGDFEKLPAGPYVAVITEATDNENKQYVEIVYDIAEGEHKGYYSTNWGKEHPLAHRIVLSYRDTALGMLKGRLEAIQASNPGFDAFAAWDAGRLDMFRGRLVGINLQEEEYERDKGGIGVGLDLVQVVDAQKVRDGLVKTRERKTLDAKKAHVPTTQAEKAAFNDVDIPF